MKAVFFVKHQDANEVLKDFEHYGFRSIKTPPPFSLVKKMKVKKITNGLKQNKNKKK